MYASCAAGAPPGQANSVSITGRLKNMALSAVTSLWRHNVFVRREHVAGRLRFRMAGDQLECLTTIHQDC